MNRTIEYKITEEQNGLRVEQFLRAKVIPVRILPRSSVCPKAYL